MKSLIYYIKEALKINSKTKVIKTNYKYFPKTKEELIENGAEYTIDNPNPVFEVELKDFKHAQLGINRSTRDESVYFKVTKKKRKLI